MMTAKWADYAFGYPGGAALKAAGFTGAIRYVGIGSSGKRITAAEYADLTAHGLQVLLCVELGVHDAEGGYSAGVSNAQTALADARSLGIPDSVGIAAVCDEHITSAQVGACVDYVRGFRDVLGQSRTGAYGFGEFVDAVHARDYAGWWWKCGTAPTATEAQWITFWQRNAGTTTQTVNRVTVDIDDQDNPLAEDDMATVSQEDFDALKWRVETLLSNLPAVPDGPTKGEPNQLFAALRDQNSNLLNYRIGTPDAPAGTTPGRQVWDVFGDGERVLAATKALSAPTLTADQLTALEQAVTAAVQAGQASQATPAQIAVATVSLIASRLGATA